MAVPPASAQIEDPSTPRKGSCDKSNTNPDQVPATIPMPPSVGVGTWCELRGFGQSSSRRRVASFSTSQVTASDTTKAIPDT